MPSHNPLPAIARSGDCGPTIYPLSAIVGSDDLVLALLLASVSPEIGGVLVRGEKGTAKTTAVRALATVLPPIEVIAGDRFSSDPRDPASQSPDGPFPEDAKIESRPVRLIELPVGATEDRVLGSLHLQRVLADGVAEYEPGLLARAHRGILYIDEVNLLHDHLVDILLDAAATGRVTVERDAVSLEYASRFVLIGTMNPEEGELRPQLLDRFGLTVDVAAPRDPQLRSDVVRRRLAFDADPAVFVEQFAAAEDMLRARIAAARESVTEVELDDESLTRIATICAAFDVDGMRADIVTARAAAAHAALRGSMRIETEDIKVAARLALPHRRRRNPFDAPGLDEDLLDDLLDQTESPQDEPDPEPPPAGPSDGSDDSTGPQPSGDTDATNDTESSSEEEATEANEPSEPPPSAESTDREPQTGSSASSVVVASEPYRARLLTAPGVGTGESGRRSRAITDSGRRVGSSSPKGRAGSIHLIETARAAAPHQVSRGRTGGRLLLASSDLRVAVKEGREANLVLFCVDASGSMAARGRMREVKTAIVSLLTDAYRRRDKVALITFRGNTAEIALPPTGSVEAAVSRLQDLPAGGRTPLAEALAKSAHLLSIERVRDPRRRALLVVVTDGRATSGPDAVARSRTAAAHLRASPISCVVVDCETGRFRMGLAAQLAETLGAEYLPVGEVSALALTQVAERFTDRGTSRARGAA